MASGYNKFERDVIVGEGLARFRNLKQKVEENKRPMYRTANWNEYQRNLDKVMKRNNWYGTETESVVFVQATPGEILRKAVQKEANLSGVKVKVVEKEGKDIKSMLQRSDVQPRKKCHKENSIVCMVKLADVPE